jgi:hypothetical protein
MRKHFILFFLMSSIVTHAQSIMKGLSMTNTVTKTYPIDVTTGLGVLLPIAGRDLYNGNIAGWSTNMRYPANISPTYAYKQQVGQLMT